LKFGHNVSSGLQTHLQRVLDVVNSWQDATQHSKLNTLVTFPVSGLDISRHSRRQNLPTSSQRDASSSKLTSSPWLTWKPGRKIPDSPDDHIYDLYAVCNHYGNMQGGHYTGQWIWVFLLVLITFAHCLCFGLHHY